MHRTAYLYSCRWLFGSYFSMLMNSMFDGLLCNQLFALLESHAHYFRINTKQYCFCSMHFPLSNASKSNLKPIILKPIHQPVTQLYIHIHYTKECITLHQSVLNITLYFLKSFHSYRYLFSA